MPKTNSQGGKKPAPAPAPAEALAPINGTDGDDVISLGVGPNGGTTIDADLVFGGLGNDTIDGDAGNDELHGEAGNDILYGGDGNDTLYGEDGADELYGGAGLDTLYGGFGTDVLAGGADDDTLYGGDDIDILDGEAGNDTLYGEGGDDYLIGGEGDDFIFGGAGDDTIFEGAGSDTIDVGEGNDTVIYYGTAGEVGTPDVDYIYEPITVTEGHGKNQIVTVVGYYIYAQDGSGDVDTINNIEFDSILFLPLEGEGSIFTETDAVFTRFDSDVTFDVLANDTGDGLFLSDILDIQIDLDGDGVNDLDLIPDGATLTDFESGVVLDDGSILTLNLDGTLTWDPNGQYDVQPPAGELWPSISFWYEVTDSGAATDYGDVTIQVTYPAPTGDITFENMQLWDETLAQYFGYYIYMDGPDNVFFVSQLTTATGFFEERDVSVTDGDYDYDGDGDAEFRIWTDGDGTTHEMNVVHGYDELFDLDSVTFSGVDAGDTVTIEYWSLDGLTLEGTDTVAVDSLISGDGVHYVYYTNQTDVGQVSFIADAGDSVFIDDLVLA